MKLTKYDKSTMLSAIKRDLPEIDDREAIQTALDNRKAFLRPATYAENGYNQGIPANNTSGHKGVHWHRAKKKWNAKIGHEGRRIHLGYFTNIEEAAQAYKEAALKYHGEFANFGAHP